MRTTSPLGAGILGLVAAAALGAPASAQCPAADSLEPNDDCLGAVTMTAGSTTGLTLFGAANAGGVNLDFYKIDVATGNVLTVDIFFIDANGDTDLYLYDSTSPNCGGTASGDYLVRGFSTSDDEQVSWTNSTGSTQTYWIMVDPFGTSYDCNDYDMTITVAPDPCVSPVDDSFEENDTCGMPASLAAGSHTGLFVSDSDFDYYTISVPANDALTVDASYGGQDVDLALYDDLACANEVDSDFGSGGAATVSWSNATGSAATVVLLAEVAAGEGCNNYDLNVATAPDPCLVGGDDSFEENDDCASAAVLPIGSTTGLRVFGDASADDDDYYVINVPSGEILTVDVLFIHANGDIDATLFDDPACTNQVDGGFTTSDNEQLTVANGSGSAANYYLRVYAFGASHDCNDYDLNASTAPDPCSDPLADDSLEDNDDCSSPTPMNDGLTTDLFVSKADEDFYEVQVADGDMLTVDLFFIDATADVDLYLYDDQVACGDLTSYLVRGFTATDDESISWTNGTGSLETYWIQVVVYSGSTGDCNDYDMQIAGSGGVLAQPFCLGDGTADAGGGPVACPCGNESSLGAGEGCESSLGMGAVLTATGTSVVANNDLVFTITQARPNQPSLLIQGVNQVAFPFKDGILCMGTPTERIEVVFLDAAGEGSTTSSIATEGNVTPGDTRYYQQWYRDPGGVSPCGTGSNFTHGQIVNWI